MKISSKTDYCLKAILDLAKHYESRLVHIDELSQRQDIPKKFLGQLLLNLKKGGFVWSKKGPNGGYSLTRDPKEIILGEVIRFVEGTIYSISCIDPDAKQRCDFMPKCPFNSIWKDVEKVVSQIIDNISFAELIEKEAVILKQMTIDYEI